jgi:hypothetical protein
MIISPQTEIKPVQRLNPGNLTLDGSNFVKKVLYFLDNFDLFIQGDIRLKDEFKHKNHFIIHGGSFIFLKRGDLNIFELMRYLFLK